MFEVVEEFPMLALILQSEATPMHMGSTLAWWIFAGIQGQAASRRLRPSRLIRSATAAARLGATCCRSPHRDVVGCDQLLPSLPSSRRRLPERSVLVDGRGSVHAEPERLLGQPIRRSRLPQPLLR